MARILLISDECHSKAVASVLENRGHTVTLLSERRRVQNHIDTDLAQINIIILNFSNRPEDWELLDKVRRLTVTCFPKPGILCLSRLNLGTEVRLRVQQKGARLVYERPA